MERGSKRSGSAVVLVLILSTFIMVIATVSLRSGTLLYELALDRVAYLKQLRAAQALAFYGIAYCKTIRGSKPQSHSLSFDHWPPPNGPYEGEIVIEQTKKGFMVGATLSKQGEGLNYIQAEIGRQKDGWRIVGWRSPR